MTDLRTEVRTALSVKIPATSVSPPLTQTTPPAAHSTAPPTTSSSPCCEGGRLLTDPHTGQTICSCRYTNPLLAGAYRVPGLPESVYTQAAYAAQAGGYPGFSPSDPSTFYSPLNSAYALKDSMEAWRAALPPTAGVYPYDMAAYPYGYAGMDLNGARRKNATRESTSTLKAWLQEHIKNPYPTKGEKIMLAIITKMTLTQVSTWFANARRRLKKENKMTWSPKNRCDDDDDDDEMKDGSDGEEKDRHHQSDEEDDEHIDLTSTNYEDRLSSPPAPTEKSASSPEKVTAKPKIWSLADTATSVSPPSGRKTPVNNKPHPSTLASVWNPAALYTGAYTYASPFHQRYAAPMVPGLTKMGEELRAGVSLGTRIQAFSGVSEAGVIHPAFSGVPAAFRPVEKALMPR